VAVAVAAIVCTDSDTPVAVATDVAVDDVAADVAVATLGDPSLHWLPRSSRQ